MRNYVGTLWRFQYRAMGEEFLVVDEKDDSACVVLELKTQIFHPAVIMGWEDRLWVHRFYRGEYFDNHTLVPIERLPSREITSL